jgi:hypothetical protein
VRSSAYPSAGTSLGPAVPFPAAPSFVLAPEPATFNGHVPFHGVDRGGSASSVHAAETPARTPINQEETMSPNGTISTRDTMACSKVQPQ